MHNTTCALCDAKRNYRILYEANFKLSDFNEKIFSARRIPDRIHYQIVKCNNDGLVRSNPIISLKTLSKLYVKSSFTYQKELNALSTTYMQAVSGVLQRLKKNSFILEIGCGNGFFLHKLIDHGYQNVWGIEPSIDAIKKANGSIRSKITQGLFKKNIFPPKSVDAIFCFQTLDHIPDPNVFLTNCHSALKDGGVLVLFLHNINSVSAQILREKSPIIDIEHTFLYSPTTLQALLEKHHFSHISTKTPYNYVSIRHVLSLLPIKKTFKQKLLTTRSTLIQSILAISLWLPLGNMCIVAEKNAHT